MAGIITEIRKRKSGGQFGYGITTADRYIRQAVKAAGEAVTQRYFGGLHIRSAIAESRRKLVYANQDMAMEKTATVGAFKDMLGDKIKAPPNTLMLIKHVVTSTREDRDEDVLHTAGARPDPRAPLLWQHLPALPLGKMVAVVEHTDHVLKAVEALLDLNDMTEDAAKLIEADVLRFSHGFRPLKYAERITKGEDGSEMLGPGYDIFEFEVMENSLVSVPSNVDAEVELYSRSKLHSDYFKSHAKGLWDQRRKQAPGFSRALADTEDAQAQPESGRPALYTHAVAAAVKEATTATKEATPPTKERWNRSLSKAFDVERAQLEASRLEYDWISRYLSVEIKEVFQVDEEVHGAWLGTFFWGMQEAVKTLEAKRDDLRNLTRDGKEEPPVWDTIQLSATKSESFVIEGLAFYKSAGFDFVLKTYPTWTGIKTTIYARRQDSQKAIDLRDSAWEMGREQNFLRGEAFALSGEFLPTTKETWDDVIVTKRNSDAIDRTVKLINTRGAEVPNRGVLMMGPPGTGKTLTGRVIRNTADATFIWVSTRDFRRCGSSAWTMAFDLAKELAPTVIFFEDVDDNLYYSIDLLKTEMDGIGRSKGVVTMLTTNFPESIPEALIDRPGRFHDVLKFDLPTADLRERMVRRWLPSLTAEQTAKAVASTNGYSGSHIWELAYLATTIQDQDGIELDKAVEAAIAKITEQRQMIADRRTGGSRKATAAWQVTITDAEHAMTYTPKNATGRAKNASEPTTSTNTHKAGRVVSEANLAALQTAKADIDAAAQVSDVPLAATALLERSSVKLQTVIDSATEPPAPAADANATQPGPVESAQASADIQDVKAGRVLNQRNAELLQEVADDLVELAGMRDIPRAAAALIERSKGKVDMVIKAATPETTEQTDNPVAGATPTDDLAIENTTDPTPDAIAPGLQAPPVTQASTAARDISPGEALDVLLASDQDTQERAIHALLAVARVRLTDNEARSYRDLVGAGQ